MELYLNENEAVEDIKETLKDITNDLDIYVRGRDFSGGIKKKVTFIVVVLPSFGEAVFNAFVKAYASTNKKMNIVKSDTFLDNAKRKEAFYLECNVKC